jgi:hypothetical protein
MFQQFENVAYCIVDLLYFFTTKTEIQSPFERLARFFLPNVYTKGIDCILSRFKLIKLSLSTNTRAVVEEEPYSYHIEFRFFIRGLTKFLTLLPLGTIFNRVPFMTFDIKVVVKFLRKFPSLSNNVACHING